MTNATTVEAPQGLELPWKDCECGCHGNTLVLGSQVYWYMAHVRSDNYELRNGHGQSLGQRLGLFKDRSQMNQHIRAVAVPGLRREIRKAEEALALFAEG